MEHTSIRLATAKDAETIAQIINSAWQTAYAGIVPQAYLDSLKEIPRAQRLTEGLEQFPDLRYYLFEEDGIPVGTASLHPTHDEDLTGTAEFTFFYFLPSVWRRGYGRLLLDRLKEDARGRGFRNICCWVLKENTHAISFYESQGMLRDGKRQTITIGEPLEVVRCFSQL
ncbi:MAG: GNAT family N-acetyltransferase [Eubacteriales bacterium]|nr:GNAT family N-acetyltransferase [Eubacteriales bacterium]